MTAPAAAAGPVVADLPAGHATEPPTEPQPSGATATAQQQRMAAQGMVPSVVVRNNVASAMNPRAAWLWPPVQPSRALSASAVGLTAAAVHAQIAQQQHQVLNILNPQLVGAFIKQR